MEVVFEVRDDGELHELHEKRAVAGARRDEREHRHHDGERAEEPVHEVARAGHLRGKHALAHRELALDRASAAVSRDHEKK